LFEANRLALVRERRVVERRAVADFLDLAGCTGDERARAVGLAPHGPDEYVAEVAWYLLKRV
jgi:hypothetical protein